MIPRNPQAYQTFFDNLLFKNNLLKVPNNPATAQLSSEGVVRVTVLYDIDETMKSMQVGCWFVWLLLFEVIIGIYYCIDFWCFFFFGVQRVV